MLADVIPHYDGLRDRYEKIRVNTEFPLYIRQAAERAWHVLNKYYSKSDESVLCRLAICKQTPEISVLLEADWVQSPSSLDAGTLSQQGSVGTGMD